MSSDNQAQTEPHASELPDELAIIPSNNGSETTLQGSVDDEDNTIQQRYDNPSSYRFRRLASKTIVSFGPDDTENPHNWSKVCNPFPPWDATSVSSQKEAD